jgi:hypothetical protein
MTHININLQGEDVGSVTFDQPETALSGSRTASGFRLYIPATVDLCSPQGSQSALLLENLRLTFLSSGVEIGIGRYSGVIRTTAHKLPVSFVWDWTLPALAFYEQIRAGSEPDFSVLIAGEIRYVVPGDGWKELCSIATGFSHHGSVRYSRETWTNMLRQLNLRDAVLVEIPFQSDPPNGWEPIWQALRDARNSFDAGGSTGWKNCVVSVRHALENWQSIEKEDQGPGWQRPATADLQTRTKAQRIDNIRWHLVQLAHYAAHTKADEWTRDDALLALSALSALISVRKP